MDAYSPKSKENLTVTSFFSDGDDLPFNIIYLVKEKDTNLLFDFLPKYDMVLFHFFSIIFYVFQKMCHRFVHIRPLLGIFCFFSMFCFRGQNSLNLHRLVPGNPGTVIRLRLKLWNTVQRRKHCEGAACSRGRVWRQGPGLVSGSGSGGRQGVCSLALPVIPFSYPSLALQPSDNIPAVTSNITFPFLLLMINGSSCIKQSMGWRIFWASGWIREWVNGVLLAGFIRKVLSGVLHFIRDLRELRDIAMKDMEVAIWPLEARSVQDRA